MPGLASRFSVIATAVLATVGLAATQKSKVVAHEWGTFTTVAGADGRAVEWIPLGGPLDLPCFVNVFGADEGLPPSFAGKGVVLRQQPAPSIARSGAYGSENVQPRSGDTLSPPILSYELARANLRGTVRMETPVIYFYSPRSETVNVGVEFPTGFMSEWYPSALVTQPPPRQIPLDSNLRSTILWKDVAILPGTAPALKTEQRASHYYAARQTDANPIRVNGQDEKFLFYRGIGGFQVPIVATEGSDGSISVKNTGKVPVPAVVLFENRDGKIGYRMLGSLAGEAQLAPVSLTGDVVSLGRDLESILVAAGMYEREAQAMVDTWRDSWFEEGTRLFYVMPPSTVDEVLPLAIIPRPAETARAFVGRLEIITRETVNRVSIALDTENEEMLLRYGRFLGPITDRMLDGVAPVAAKSTKAYVDRVFRAFIQQTEAKCN